jgi:hypothetical protein
MNAYDLSGLKGEFDIILLSDLVNDLWDVQRTFEHQENFAHRTPELSLTSTATPANAAYTGTTPQPRCTHAVKLAHPEDFNNWKHGLLLLRMVAFTPLQIYFV